MEDLFKDYKNIHFIGIGGAKVSYLAYFFTKYLKKEVTGSNLTKNCFTDRLSKDLGIKIFIGKNHKNNVSQNTDLVIYSLAVKNNNPEIINAKNSHIAIMSAPEILGEITKKIATISVAGSHGKGTTAALISLILREAGFLKLSFLGMSLKEFDGLNLYYNGNIPDGYLVLESDEWQEDFLNYSPRIICLVNLDYEHPDFFKNINEEIRTFEKFLCKLPYNGVLIVNKDNKNILKLIELKTVKNFIKKNKINVIPFSLNDKISKQIHNARKIKGKMILEDYLASYKLAEFLGIKDDIIFKVFRKFQGGKRRLELKYFNSKGLALIDDYAHNPQKIMASIESMRDKYSNRNVLIIYEPHQIQRTYYLKDELIKSLSLADFVGILPIFEVAGREDGSLKNKISSEELVKELKKNKKKSIFFNNFQEAANFIKENLHKKCVIITMGVGSIQKIYKYLKL